MSTTVQLFSNVPGLEDEHWYRSAVCAQVDPEVMYPGKGGLGVGDAKRLCRECPVKRDCLIDAAHGEQLETPVTDLIFGVRAGLSAYKREQVYEAAHKDGRLATIDDFVLS